MHGRRSTLSATARSLFIVTCVVYVHACDRQPAQSANHTEVSTAMSADDLAKQEDLAKRLELLGDQGSDAEDFTGACTAFESAKDIRVRLMAARPNDTPSLEAAATIYLKLGEALMQAASRSVTQPKPGAYDASIGAVKSAVDIRKQLSAAEPHHLGRLRDLADAYSSLVMPSLNDHLPAAVDASRAAVDLRKVLAEAAPADMEVLQELKRAYDTHAWLLLGSAKTASSPAQRESWSRQSRAAYEAALATAQELARADPAYRIKLAASYGRLADVWRTEGNLREARVAYKAALGLDKQLLPGDAELQDLIVTHHRALASVLRETREFAAAVKALEAGVALEEKFQGAAPNDLTVTRQLALTYEELGDARRDSGQKASARKAFEASYALAERLNAAGEDVTALTHSVREKLSQLH